jgi:hypothetical protein
MTVRLGVVAALLWMGCGSGAALPASGSGGVGGTTTSSGGAGAGGAGASAGAGASGAAGATGGAVGTAGATGAGGGAVASGCGKDLSGTWDLIATRVGFSPGAGVMVIGPGVFSITVMNPGGPTLSPHGHFDYSADAKQFTFQQGGSPIRTISAQNTPAPLNAGSIPLALGGAWQFNSMDDQCTAQAMAGLLSVRCLSTQSAYNVGQDSVGSIDWPRGFPLAVNGRTYSATRSAPAASSFGDLGGTWLAQSDAATGRSCTVTISGHTLTASCTADRIKGTTAVTIGDDCIASGTNNTGYELSGRRR